jgi:diadenosine tetraphosphate (Ap4A) HIT family hydrolase
MNINEASAKQIIEYLKIHLISLYQDSEFLEKQMDEYINYEDDDYRTLEIEDISNNGQIIATQHILSVVADILGINLEKEKLNANV